MDTWIDAVVVRVRGTVGASTADRLAVERPLSIQVRAGDSTRTISTTMRTPGQDRALAAGFLFAEGVISGAECLQTVENTDEDTVLVDFAPAAAAAALEALEATQRSFVTSGACGVCGRSNLEGLMNVTRHPSLKTDLPRIAAAVIHRLPDLLRMAQATFAHTGGLHAAGLFTVDGRLQSLHEDVGRHNAVDKLVGARLLERKLPADDALLVVSGRASFELVQKAAAAGFPVMAAVGAPSSLAVEMARATGLTLLGFVRNGGFNIYCGQQRLEGIDLTSTTDFQPSPAESRP